MNNCAAASTLCRLRSSCSADHEFHLRGLSNETLKERIMHKFDRIKSTVAGYLKYQNN